MGTDGNRCHLRLTPLFTLPQPGKAFADGDSVGLGLAFEMGGLGLNCMERGADMEAREITGGCVKSR